MSKSMLDLAIDRMSADIARHQATINRLGSEGRACADTEEQLKRLSESLTALRTERSG
jgi:hypothetical protein